MEHDEKSNWVISVVRDFVLTSPANNLQNGTRERAWDAPLVGFSQGDDPLFRHYKEVVGPFHWTPREAFELAFPSESVAPHELTVVSWVLPQTEATKADNRTQTVYPAERWARSRIYGEAFNNALREHVVGALQASGYPAVAPMLLPLWETRESDQFVIASTWSERHAAYAAGLGTFGLCDGLITPKGKAMRVGSVVARIEIPPSPRPYEDHHAYCLLYSEGICGRCIGRCPVGAISESGHDKVKCRQHTGGVTSKFVKENYGFDGYGCGLCQTAVPCESGIPAADDL